MSLVQRDYILRLVEQMGQVLAVVLGLKKSGEPAEAIQVMNGALQGLVGFDLDDIERMRAEDLVQMVRLARSGQAAPGEMVAGELTITARLLAEAAEVYELQGDTGRRDNCRLKALQIYLIVLTEEDPGLALAADAVPPLLETLEGYELPYSTVGALFQFHEHAGEYAKAEDRLFELLEDERADAAVVVERGLAFFSRLSRLPDDVLENGGLPRDEVEAGLAELRSLQAG